MSNVQEGLFPQSDSEAKTIHEQLLSLLKPEHDQRSWIEFTALAYRSLPALAEGRGRPTKEQIANSFVGELGFGSWKEYLCASKKIGGLDFSDTVWQRYREAYRAITKSAWLANMNLSPDQIRVIVRNYGDDMPLSEKEFKEREVARTNALQEEKERKAAQRKADLEELPVLRQKVIELTDQLNAKTGQVNQIMDSKNELNQEVGRLNQEIADLSDRLSSAEQRGQKAESTLAEVEKAVSALVRLSNAPVLGRVLRLYEAWQEALQYLPNLGSQQRPKRRSGKKKK